MNKPNILILFNFLSNNFIGKLEENGVDKEDIKKLLLSVKSVLSKMDKV